MSESKFGQGEVDPTYVWNLVQCYLAPDVRENEALLAEIEQRVRSNAAEVEAAVGPFIRDYVDKDLAKKGPYLSVASGEPLRYRFRIGPFTLSNVPQPDEGAREGDFEEADIRFRRAIGLE